MNPGGGRALEARVERDAGYYWVRVRDPKLRHVIQMGRFIPECWVGVEPWRVDGQWFRESAIIVLSERLVPPLDSPVETG